MDSEFNINMENKLVEWLFKTGAFKVSPHDRPFWYTSGTIGPYYINTHFLYGGEKEAAKMLQFIDEAKNDIYSCSERLLNREKMIYSSDQIYKGLVDYLVAYIKEIIDNSHIAYISGGERRDWYFSLLPADILGIPHITLFKDGEAVIYYKGKTTPAKDLNGGKVLHIADIVTEASSFIRNWIPAVGSIGGNLAYSLVVIDRMQGGAENLKAAGVEANSLISVSQDLFDAAKKNKLLSDEQYELLIEYAKDPRGSMRSFLINNPGFLEESLKADERTASRARLCIENKLYMI